MFELTSAAGGKVFFGGIKDKHYQVRETASICISKLLGLVNDKEQFFNDIYQLLQPMLERARAKNGPYIIISINNISCCKQTKKPFPHQIVGNYLENLSLDEISLPAYTSLIALVHFASSCHQIEPRVLFHLIDWSSKKDFVLRKIISSSAIPQIARKLGYNSTIALLEDNFRYIFCMWFDENRTLEDFPLVYFQEPLPRSEASKIEDADSFSMKSLLQNYGRYVWPFVAKNMNKKAMDFICKELAMNLKELIKFVLKVTTTTTARITQQ